MESSLAVVNPQVNTDALSGLVLILRAQAPTLALLTAVLSLPAKFGRFVAVTVTGWMSSHYTLLLSCLQQLCADNLLKDGRFKKSEDDEENNGKSGLRRSAIFPLLHVACARGRDYYPFLLYACFLYF